MKYLREKLCKLAQKRYKVDWQLRQYHNWEHALDVYMYAIELQGGNADLELELAALYHDAVYVPGAGSNANELCSAAALKVDALKCGFDISVIEKAQQLIRQTSINFHLITPIEMAKLHPSDKSELENKQLAVLLDADLASLAREWDRFVKKQIDILTENGADDTPENRAKSALFLKQFLTCRDKIYHTEFARKHYEAAARENITRWIAENSI